MNDSPIVSVKVKSRYPIEALFDYPITLEMLDGAASYSATMDTVYDELTPIQRVTFRYYSKQDIEGVSGKPVVSLYFEKDWREKDNYLFLRHKVQRMEHNQMTLSHLKEYRESPKEVMEAIAHFVERRWGIDKSHLIK